MVYDFAIIGAGIAGSSVAHFLKKYGYSVCVVDKDGIAGGASGAAGAFLSPLLGKPNPFKELVNKALVFSIDYYKSNFPTAIEQCGVLRVAKDKIDEKKFVEYEPYMDFEYIKKEISSQVGYYFPIGSLVDSSAICKGLLDDIDIIEKEITTIEYNDTYKISDNIEAKNIVLATGANDILNEPYIQIRPVWGQRIDIESNTQVEYNIHKNNSISMSKDGTISLGATHHVWQKELPISSEDTQKLIEMSKELINIDSYKVIKEVGGARACSVDYFPLLGEIVDSSLALEEFGYLKNGTHVEEKRLPKYKNLYIINGVGGRGFVLSPYLGKMFAEHIKNNQDIQKQIKPTRLFNKWVRKQK
jgi:tRNA U-34 5-methylaminomethyl-2-thiouridine biosynthesis protein MnmC